MASRVCCACVKSITITTKSSIASRILIPKSNNEPQKNSVFAINFAPFSHCRSIQPVRFQKENEESGKGTKANNIVRAMCDARGLACRDSAWSPVPRTAIRPKILNRRSNASKYRNFSTINSLLGKKAKKREVVIPDPDYRIPIVLLGIAGGYAYQENLLPAATAGLLGLLLFFQTTRVRFVFDDEALEVKVGNELQESGENVFVGGKNRWKYSSFVNWELWWPKFPVLVYFRETQTKPEGQVHFFPVIFNGKQLYDVMVERAGSSKTSGPK